jgi:hypothetical protein
MLSCRPGVYGWDLRKLVSPSSDTLSVRDLETLITYFVTEGGHLPSRPIARQSRKLSDNLKPMWEGRLHATLRLSNERPIKSSNG